MRRVGSHIVTNCTLPTVPCVQLDAMCANFQCQVVALLHTEHDGIITCLLASITGRCFHVLPVVPMCASSCFV